jgi:hypothetical protein
MARHRSEENGKRIAGRRIRRVRARRVEQDAGGGRRDGAGSTRAHRGPRGGQWLLATKAQALVRDAKRRMAENDHDHDCPHPSARTPCRLLSIPRPSFHYRAAEERDETLAVMRIINRQFASPRSPPALMGGPKPPCAPCRPVIGSRVRSAAGLGCGRPRYLRRGPFAPRRGRARTPRGSARSRSARPGGNAGRPRSTASRLNASGNTPAASDPPPKRRTIDREPCGPTMPRRGRRSRRWPGSGVGSASAGSTRCRSGKGP